MTGSRSALHRRTFLGNAASGLILALHLPKVFAELAPVPPGGFAPNAWIRISPDDVVTFIIDRSDMGQGVVTSLSMLLAEELECDWKRVRFEFAPLDPAYFHALFGNQGTGGSASVRGGWKPLSQAGAAAREMLLEAAAERWRIDKSACRAHNGMVTNTVTSARATFGSLAEAASRLPVPKAPPLKDPSSYTLLRKRVKGLDTPLKTTGKARYGIDVRQPGMLHAVVARCPVFGGKVASLDATKTKSVAGVKEVVPISSGLAVIADNTWSAIQGRNVLDVKWDEGQNGQLDSAEIRRQLAERVRYPGAEAKKVGDAVTAFDGSTRQVEAVYEVPFLAHACMEPMNCAAYVRDDRCDVWGPTQFQTAAGEVAAKLTDLKMDQIHIHTTYLGGGFGRRAMRDFIAEAVELSKTIDAPVQVTWSREDDLQHDYYRPTASARLSAVLDGEGWPIAWKHGIASPSVITWLSAPERIKNGIDPSSVEGAVDLPYSIPNILVDYHLVEFGVPVGPWRSVGNSQNAFFVECFMDELASSSGRDPFEFRRTLLQNSPRHLGVLELAAEKAGWGTQLPPGRFRGIAVWDTYDTFVSQVAEISVDRKSGAFRVHRVVCAVDCGQYANPAGIEAQIEGGIAFGLTSLTVEITLERGRVVQSNFHDYQVLRINEMPSVEVHIVPSKESPMGVGEPGVPPIAPAVCNAIFAATGKRVRRLPIRPADLISS